MLNNQIKKKRLWPIYDYKVLNGSYEKPYLNPGAPVHVVTGSAGCQVSFIIEFQKRTILLNFSIVIRIL